MKDEIKKITESSRKIIKSNRENGFDRIIMLGDDIDKLLDYITNLQEELEEEKRIEQASLDTINNLQDTLIDKKEYCYGLETQLTNLQEENEYFSDCDKKLRDKIKNLEYRYKVLKEEYTEKIGGITSRQDIIDKAIEHTKKEIADIEFMKKEYSDYNRIGEVEVKLESIEKLNDILNGGDDNE